MIHEPCLPEHFLMRLLESWQFIVSVIACARMSEHTARLTRTTV